MGIAILDTNIVLEFIDIGCIVDVFDMSVERSQLTPFSKHDTVGVVPYVLWEIFPQNASYIVSQSDISMFKGYYVLLQYIKLMFEILSINVLSDDNADIPLGKSVLEDIKRCLKLGKTLGSKKQKKPLQDIVKRERENVPITIKYLWQRRYSLPIECMLCISNSSLDTGYRTILLKSSLLSLMVHDIVVFIKDKHFASVVDLIDKDVFLISIPTMCSRW